MRYGLGFGTIAYGVHQYMKNFKDTFGLIVGPTGTGKSALVTKECNRFPKGVLYYNVCEPTVFARKLAETVGMKI